jgi:hypothetical protein
MDNEKLAHIAAILMAGTLANPLHRGATADNEDLIRDSVRGALLIRDKVEGATTHYD